MLGRSARGARAYSSARPPDFYAVLQVPFNASKAQIKNQFYRLSKKYHPDVSQSDEGKALFQRVSEAYATLSNDAARREYDRRRGVGLHTTHHHASTASTHAERRAQARYAWEYQRRTHAHTHTASPRYGAHAHTHGAASDSTHIYGRMAEREARLERFRSRFGTPTTHANPDSFRAWSQRRWSDEEYQAERASTLVRLVQVGAVFGGAAWLGHRLFS